MDKDEVNIWFDREADYLEVNFEKKKGFYRETDHEEVMEKVDSEGNLIGFSIQNVSQSSSDHTLSIDLEKHTA